MKSVASSADNDMKKRFKLLQFRNGLIETLEILADPNLAASLRKSIKELEQGKTIPWEQVKRKLGDAKEILIGTNLLRHNILTVNFRTKRVFIK